MIKIKYSSLVLVPLIYLNKTSINTKEIQDYAKSVKRIYDSNLQEVSFDLDNASKLFFELTHFWWVDSTMREDGETEYSLKGGLDVYDKSKLLNETHESIRAILTDDDALEVFSDASSLQRRKNN